MIPTIGNSTAPVAPPAYHRAQARLGPALHIDALTLVTTLHLLALCRLAVRLAHSRCPPPLPAGPGGAPRTYREETLLLIGLLRTLWRLSYQDTHERPKWKRLNRDIVVHRVTYGEVLKGRSCERRTRKTFYQD